MKNISKILVCGLAVAACACPAKADSLKDLLGGGSLSNIGETLGSVVKETLAQSTSSSLTVADLEGTWKSTGPAVVLKSDNVLEQAGGATVTTTVEKKIKPYYTKLGLNNVEMTFDSEGNFSLTIKKIPVKGTITKGDDGAFTLSLTSGVSKLSKANRTMTVYVQKSGSSMSISADVKKLVEIVEKVASAADNSTINSVIKLLDSYDNVCLGFRMSKQ